MTRQALTTLSTFETIDRETTRSDESLLRAYCDHADRQAFDTLVHRYERDLYSYLLRYLGDAAAAEDVFQACFLQVHLRCQQFEHGRTFKPWLYTIATNAAIDSLRRARRHRMVSLNQRNDPDNDDLGSLVDLLTSREAAPTANLESTERQQWIRQAVAELPDLMRSVVTMIYYQGLKYREVAVALNLPVGTVKSRMHGAILRLNRAWQATEATPAEKSAHA